MPFERHRLPHADGVLPYLHARPTAQHGATSLLLFLHGARDRGDDLDLLLRWAPPRQVAESSALPHHFVAPQIPADATWGGHAGAVFELIDHLVATEGVDPARVVLAGFSLGAAGVWQLATLQPDGFAGLIAVSGRVPDALDLRVLQGKPAWVVHGGRDDKVAAADTERALGPLRPGGGLRFTLLPDGDHFIADQAFADPALQAWLAGLAPTPHAQAA